MKFIGKLIVDYIYAHIYIGNEKPCIANKKMCGQPFFNSDEMLY